MERTIAWLGVLLPEQFLFLAKSGAFLCASGMILYVALASSYPAVHDTLRELRGRRSRSVLSPTGLVSQALCVRAARKS